MHINNQNGLLLLDLQHYNHNQPITHKKNSISHLNISLFSSE
ncbi:hypothetical protein XIS1_460130 [Xenorhabdus innexi]|uniref:Uncharacterized protein n=1 Tax=Xenorhabdus innexi TaxID=290109 RepID=A0A1N6MY72_9GAMM|nr:hypothetical protein XIS1_460130 [Xenorhabdus innexi]